VKRLGALVDAIGQGVATARHPQPGTQSIWALPPEVAAMPKMDYVPPRPAPAGPAKVIATAIEVLARAVVPARITPAHAVMPARDVIPAKAGIALLWRQKIALKANVAM